jgi:hypothetical protein
MLGPNLSQIPVHGYPRCIDIHHACLDLSILSQRMFMHPAVHGFHRVYRVSSFLSLRRNWFHPPPPPPPAPQSHPQAIVAPSPFGSKEGGTLDCGGGGGWPQFRRRDKHSGTLCMYSVIPLLKPN